MSPSSGILLGRAVPEPKPRRLVTCCYGWGRECPWCTAVSQSRNAAQQGAGLGARSRSSLMRRCRCVWLEAENQVRG